DAVGAVEGDGIAGAGALAADGVVGRLIVDVDTGVQVGQGRDTVGGSADEVAHDLRVGGLEDLNSGAAVIGRAGEEIAGAGCGPADHGAVRLVDRDAGAAVGHRGRTGGVGAEVVALHG